MVKAPSSPASGVVSSFLYFMSDYVLRLSRLLRGLTITALTAGDATWLAQSLVHEASASMRILINNGDVQIRGPYIDGPITGVFNIKNDYVLKLSRLSHRLTIAALTAGDPTWLVQSLVHEAFASMRILTNNGDVQIRGPYTDGPITGFRQGCNGSGDTVWDGIWTARRHIPYGVDTTPRHRERGLQCRQRHRWKDIYQLLRQTIAVRGDSGTGADCGGGLNEDCGECCTWGACKSGAHGGNGDACAEGRVLLLAWMDGQEVKGGDGRVAVWEGDGGWRSWVAGVYRDGLPPA
ncbi:hypothetical protein EDD18DRAFT_1105770 [Armillaria luteobubalina]|uniref:Uncharacterized protein n=1 Tax=Armillaria luteobubalina TaxID=153913 RepID=A0AA39Q4C3_9AGAR|nr:hypothetical protein EDD18DRAFT_1105770 [Armillaria luteobubalina]